MSRISGDVLFAGQLFHNLIGSTYLLTSFYPDNKFENDNILKLKLEKYKNPR